MIKTNFLKFNLNKDKLSIGTWITIPSVINADIISSSGLDFAIIDMEHGPISYETAQELIITFESKGVSPLIRIGQEDDISILRALDIGAHGLVFPGIKNSEQLAKIILSTKYPPKGIRGYSPFVRATDYTYENSADYFEAADNNILICAIIEGSEGIKNLVSIINSNHLDMVFVGIFDLSANLGIPSDTDNPLVTNELKKIITKCHNKKIKVGTIANTPKQLSLYKKLGVDFVTYSVDSFMLKQSYSIILSHSEK